MLHTLNHAYVDLLARQLQNGIIKNCLCIVGPDSEFDIVLEAMKKYQVYIKVLYVEEVECGVKFQWLYNVGEDIYPILKDEMYDDILITHDLHDIFAKDYLCRHCRRKGG